MINSMTGFGQARGENRHARVSVEIKSLNHRYLETVLHLPDGYASLEPCLKKEIRRRIKRGRLTLSFNIIAIGEDRRLVINSNLAKDYLASINRLKRSLGLKGEFGLDALINLPGVISLKEFNSVSVDSVSPLVKKAVSRALDRLVQMRRREGEGMFKELSSIIKRITADLDFITSRFNGVIEGKKRQLSDEDFSLFLKSQDVSEELARLKIHLKNFKDSIVKINGAQGKQLDFISQELQREINTLGVKLPDIKVSQKVVRVKAGIDKLREQLQNVE